MLLRRFCAAGLAGSLTVNQTTHGAPWWTSGVPPTWTDIISCAPERQVDGRFPRFGTSGMESKGSDGRNSGPGRCRCPPQNHGSSLIGGARIVIHGSLLTQAQQQIHHYPTGQRPTQPLLHRESASRALRKLRSFLTPPVLANVAAFFAKPLPLGAWPAASLGNIVAGGLTLLPAVAHIQMRTMLGVVCSENSDLC